MNKEIREVILRFIKEAYIDGYNARANGAVWEQEDGSVDFPQQGVLIKTLILEQELAKKGVAIKVDRELPKFKFGKEDETGYEDLTQLIGSYYKEAGYVATEPIIEEPLIK